MKRIVILGSTGSVGTSALDVAAQRPDDFKIVGLSAHRNVRLLAEQIRRFAPLAVSVSDAPAAHELAAAVDLAGIDVFSGRQSLERLATLPEADIVLVATAGTVSLLPTLAAIDAGKRIALANKEPLVMAGSIIMQRLRRSRAELIPVDSEHSAIFQCLQGQPRAALRRIYLTGSGGPFRTLPAKKFAAVTPAMALRHPKWSMGRKISIDSATLMNKGLELIEACCLFDVAEDQVEIIVHPEAIVHSMVEFCDGAVMAHLGITDMRLPIQYAFDYPCRRGNHLPPLGRTAMAQLTMSAPDLKRFPCLRIARDVARQAGTAGCVMNAANEVAVAAFLSGTIKFTDIPRIIGKIVNRHAYAAHPSLARILRLDAWARREAEQLC
ncbi:MAG: 1-deoxy-D-xylulose-5-phosphate reductoisomerase [Candidatus Omnitrophica bacterium]|nr:1-deoxy-D-xylulose-5-phosphate reductoisomerase [Candidatus Omnitrophota bacterium]